MSARSYGKLAYVWRIGIWRIDCGESAYGESTMANQHMAKHHIPMLGLFLNVVTLADTIS